MGQGRVVGRKPSNSNVFVFSFQLADWKAELATGAVLVWHMQRAANLSPWSCCRRHTGLMGEWDWMAA
jgi:hypothetical protein